MITVVSERIRTWLHLNIKMRRSAIMRGEGQNALPSNCKPIGEYCPRSHRAFVKLKQERLPTGLLCHCTKFEVNGIEGREKLEVLGKAISWYNWTPALPGASPQFASHLLCCCDLKSMSARVPRSSASRSSESASSPSRAAIAHCAFWTKCRHAGRGRSVHSTASTLALHSEWSPITWTQSRRSGRSEAASRNFRFVQVILQRVLKEHCSSSQK